MIPFDLYFSLIEDQTGAQRGTLDVQLGLHGEVITVFANGVKVEGKVDIKDFIEVLLGQGYLVTLSDKIATERREGADVCTAYKRNADLKLERKAEGA